jgi:hypothetical protein
MPKRTAKIGSKTDNFFFCFAKIGSETDFSFLFDLNSIGSEIQNLQQLLVSISRGVIATQCKHRSDLLKITGTNFDRALINKQSDLKTAGEEQSADQSTENTCSDKPSNLIPHDKDHADDP